MLKELFKVGFYTIYHEKNKTTSNYVVDSGKTIYSKRFKKVLPNPYRDVKKFDTVEEAKQYAKSKLFDHSTKKKEQLKRVPKSLYLIIMKEESTGKTFVKVGITSKRFVLRRFSKEYGYVGYTLETILRRIDTKDAEKLEGRIKDLLSKKRGVKKYRPLLENFSGYSECFDYESLNLIIEVFDKEVSKGG